MLEPPQFIDLNVYNLVLAKCRICSTPRSIASLSKIFDNETNYGAEIYLVTGIKIVECNLVPALICQDCLLSLKASVRFRNQCMKSDEEFKKIVLSHYEERNWRENLKILKDSVEDGRDGDFLSVKCKVEIEEPDDDFQDFDHLDYSNPYESPLNPIKNEDISPKSIPPKIPSLKQPPKPSTSPKKISTKAKTVRRQNELLFQKQPICEECGKILSSNKCLKRHMRTIHNKEIQFKRSRAPKEPEDDGVEYTCDICGRLYPSRKKINDHMRWHAQMPKRDERPHGPCSVCAAFFKTRDQLNKHEVTHIPASLRNFWYCDLCGHRFKFRSLLFTHIKSRHIEKIRFYCKDCPDKSFGTKYALKNHIDFTHLQIRKHVCEYCGKGFPKAHKLKLHVRIHTGEKPYACKYCDKRFTHQTDHMRHEWAHTGTRKYCCKTCRQSYNSKEELEVHKCPWKY